MNYSSSTLALSLRLINFLLEQVDYENKPTPENIRNKQISYHPILREQLLYSRAHTVSSMKILISPILS